MSDSYFYRFVEGHRISFSSPSGESLEGIVRAVYAEGLFVEVFGKLVFYTWESVSGFVCSDWVRGR